LRENNLTIRLFGGKISEKPELVETNFRLILSMMAH